MTATSSTIDPAGQKLLVTNTLTDTVGNKLVLTVIHQRDDHKSLVLEVRRFNATMAAVITPPESDRVVFKNSISLR